LQEQHRADLNLIVMSATLQAGALEKYLKPCSVLTSEGRMFSVEIEHLPYKFGSNPPPVWELAAEAFQRSIAINPDFARGHHALGETLIYLDRLDDAIAELRKAIELEPQNPAHHRSLAQALTDKGLTAEADQEMRRAQTPP